MKDLKETFLAYEIANMNIFINFLAMLHIGWLDNWITVYHLKLAERKTKIYEEFIKDVAQMDLAQKLSAMPKEYKPSLIRPEEFEKEYLSKPDVRDPLTRAVEEQLPNFEGMDDYFKYSKSDFCSFCHSQLSGGIGMQIRNRYKLWKMKGELYEYISRKYNVTHPDDVGDKIVAGVYDKWRAEHNITSVKPPTESIFSTVLPRMSGSGHGPMRS